MSSAAAGWKLGSPESKRSGLFYLHTRATWDRLAGMTDESQTLATEMLDCSGVIRIACESDSDAARVADILQAVGYRTIRIRDGSLPHRVRALAAMAKRYGLSRREAQVLAHISRAHNCQQTADALGIVRATAKWHTHNLLAKMKCTNATQVLALILAEAVGEW